MSDLFEEVEEQLRSDRYRTLALKALPWVLAMAAAALVAALAYWGWDYYRDEAMNKASQHYAAGLDALEKGQAAEAERQFTEVGKSSARGYKSLALMQLGAIKLAAGQTPEGVKRFDAAAQAAPDAIIGDAARLRAAFALLDSAPYKDVEARLTPLLQDGHPYRVQAREALAFAKLMAGNTSGARGDFVIISGMLDAPEGARARAKAAIGLIDAGSATALAQVVHNAAALPPSALAPAAPPQPQAPGPQ